MKKKVLSLLLAFAMVFSLVACGPNTKAYLTKAQEVNSWEGAESKGKMSINFEVKDPETKETLKFNIPASFEGTQEGKKVHVTINYDFKALMELAKGKGEEAPLDIPENLKLDMFMDGETGDIIMGKDYFSIVSGGSEALNNIKENYISIGGDSDPMGMGLSQKTLAYLESAEYTSDLMKLMDTALKGYESKNDMKVEGNTFTYEASFEDLTDEFVNILANVVKNWGATKDVLASILNKAEVPVTSEQLDKAIKEIDLKELKEGTSEFKDAFKGSKISFKSTFDEGKVSQDVKLNLVTTAFSVAEEGKSTEPDKINIEMTSVTSKNSKAKVEMPKDVKKLTMSEYLELVNPGYNDTLILVRYNGELVEFEDQQPVIVEGRTLVPFRALLEKMGATDINWDEATRTVTAKHGDKTISLVIDNKTAKVADKDVELDVPAQIIGDRTMVPLRFVSENFGYKVKFDDSLGKIYMIDIYNISDEELEKALEGAPEEETKEEPAKEDKKAAATAVGIIGGADGPTAIKVVK
ncbi:copper amine oxidase N-terminal domain-containing protein [Peptoniphilus catoniae]|uniref:copper amine oxidase N-terminal domain-containing protein n=1 Tax=Peptoniphilus catoniae TaxID=1660341 RepID=UPI0010FD8206|nr:copper amine oxidase N-terminal domain-containing protein [Peptoniphilus catoniae]